MGHGTLLVFAALVATVTCDAIGDRFQALKDELVNYEIEFEKHELALQTEMAKLEELYDEHNHLENAIDDSKKEFVRMAQGEIDKVGVEAYRKVVSELPDSVDESIATRTENIKSKIKTYTAEYDMKRQWFTDKLDKLLAEANDVNKDFMTTQSYLKKAFDEAIGKKHDVLPVDELKTLRENFKELAKILMDVQYYGEQQERTSLRSGIKQVRLIKVGPRNYHSGSVYGYSFAAIHNHDNNIATVGMGEYIGVMNGVRFRTRHNDFMLKQPSKTSNKYKETEAVAYPDVPPAVYAAGKEKCEKNPTMENCDVEGQLEEMQEWFKAFVNQDHTHRDYRPFFRAVMVYIEGSWTAAKGGNIDEPFDSDRHQIDAKSWQDLQEKIRFTSYSGTKSLLENLADMPTRISRVGDDGQVEFSQWNYGILCHPISMDIPTRHLKLRIDRAAKLSRNKDDKEYYESRLAHFDIEGVDVYGKRRNIPLDYSILDAIMEEIPGKNNYNFSMKGKVPNSPQDRLYTANPKTPKKELNAAYYHRTFVQENSEGVRRQVQRGFSDRLYYAHTTQPEISHVSFKNDNGVVEDTAVTFALPLEIIYLTPLTKWNPYNIEYRDEKSSNPGGASGSENDPYPYSTSRSFFRTPNHFYSGAVAEMDSADTSKTAVFVMTPGGKKAVQSSGVRVHFHQMTGMDLVRQRYPITPISDAGSNAGKSYEALDEMANTLPPVEDTFKTYSSGTSHSDEPGVTEHDHEVNIEKSELEELLSGQKNRLVVKSESSSQHEHTFTIQLNSKNEIYIANCGGGWTPDPDKHPGQVCGDFHTNTLTPAI